MLGSRRLLIAVALLVTVLPQWASAAPAGAVQGMVTGVSSGDTVTLTLADQTQIKVRLRDIDAPESCQPGASESQAALTTLALNKVATLRPSGRDGQGRTVGILLLDDLNVSRYQVENGYAWSVRTRWDQGPLVKQEKMARALTRGLHAMPGAVLPKEFRRVHGRCQAPLAPTPAPAASAKRP